MTKVIILGGGSAGTVLANKLVKAVRGHEVDITLIDETNIHYYQPGFLFIPFGIYSKEMIEKPRDKFFPKNVKYLAAAVELIEPDSNRLILKDGSKLDYDFLMIATGSRIVPDEIEGLNEGWGKNIFDFYTIDGSIALANYLKTWKGGKLVVNIAEMPIKCPVAPLEFVFLADWWFSKNKLRNKVEIILSTPLDGLFTRPVASKYLNEIAEPKNIKVITEFNISSVDAGKKIISSFDGKEIDYDLLIEIPTNMGSKVIENSGFGDDLHFVPTERHTLLSKIKDNIFVAGDATDLPISKAGSVAHYEAEILVKNLIRRIEGKELLNDWDGHANCFIESGFNKGILIDFNYNTEPLPGNFPLPKLGPFSLLKETRINHWGKMAFKWIYWNLLLKGRKIPFESYMVSRKVQGSYVLNIN
jgi:sulfide:quinone oxidoreductase